MLKTISTFLIITVLLTSFSGCISGTDHETTAKSAFAGVLNMVPYSLFEKYDIFYSDFGRARSIHGAENIGNYSEYTKASKDDQKNFADAWNEVPNAIPSSIANPNFIGLTGFDLFAYNRAILINNAPPRKTFIIAATFDKDLVISKLTGLGYKKTEYGKYGYYGIGNDYEPSADSPISSMVGLSGWNRVAVMDGFIVTSPATEFVTAILDTIEKKTPSIMENNVCKALAERLGNPLAASLTTLERIITNPEESSDARQGFSFAIPDNWGTLKGYEAAGLGYRGDGEKRYFDIALYYTDKDSAEADSTEISNRMNSYSFSYITSKRGPFTDYFKPGSPVLDASPKGEVLFYANEVIKTEKKLPLMIIGGEPLPVRDLLFLSTEPGKYTK